MNEEGNRTRRGFQYHQALAAPLVTLAAVSSASGQTQRPQTRLRSTGL